MRLPTKFWRCIAALVAGSTLMPTPVAAHEGSDLALVTPIRLEAFVTPDSRLGLEIEFEENWPSPPPPELFSFFVEAELLVGDQPLFLVGFERHNGDAEVWGTAVAGLPGPSVYLTDSGSWLLISTLEVDDIAATGRFEARLEAAVLDSTDGEYVPLPSSVFEVDTDPAKLEVRDPFGHATFDFGRQVVLEPTASGSTIASLPLIGAVVALHLVLIGAWLRMRRRPEKIPLSSKT